MMKRPLNFLTALCQFDQALRTCIPGSTMSQRPSPASSVEQPSCQKPSAFMPQVSCVSITPGKCVLRRFMRDRPAQPSLIRFRSPWKRPPPRKETIWPGAKRGCRTPEPASLLNPLWYAMSFGLGAAAGLAGDKWSLGFVAETEKQVCEHLESHLEKLLKEITAVKPC